MNIQELLLEMPTVYRKNGIHMKIYFNDTDKHQTPHIHVEHNHVEHNHVEIVISLTNLQIIQDTSRFHRRTKKLVMQIIKSNIGFFKNQWNEHNPTRQI